MANGKHLQYRLDVDTRLPVHPAITILITSNVVLALRSELPPARPADPYSITRYTIHVEAEGMGTWVSDIDKHG